MKQAIVFYLSLSLFLMLVLLFFQSFYFEMKNKHYERMFHAHILTLAIERPADLMTAERAWQKMHQDWDHESEIKYYQAYPFILRVKTQYEDRFFFEKTLIEEVNYDKD